VTLLRLASSGPKVSKFFFLRVFLYLMIYTGTFDVLEDTETSVESKDNDNGPKQRVSRCLGLG
jgi:hypothetical protein